MSRLLMALMNQIRLGGTAAVDLALSVGLSLDATKVSSFNDDKVKALVHKLQLLIG